MPFAVLLAAVGLEYVWRAESERTQRIAFTAVWVTVIGLTTLYYQDIPRAQALVRAATVPLAVTGMAMLFTDVRFDRLSVPRIAIVSPWCSWPCTPVVDRPRRRGLRCSPWSA